MGLSYQLAGMAIFFGAHSVAIVAPAWRDRMAARLGDNAWKALYGAVSIAGFVLMIKGFGLARLQPVELYAPPMALRHFAAILMLPVFPLLFATYFSGRIKAGVRHPMLAATKLWATAHLLANGTLAEVLLFGGFLAWAIAERVRMLIASSFISLGAENLRVTVSIGGTVSRCGETAESIVKRADELMYRSKLDGRNRVTMD